jgi:hypothetical protein
MYQPKNAMGSAFNPNGAQAGGNMGYAVNRPNNGIGNPLAGGGIGGTVGATPFGVGGMGNPGGRYGAQTPPQSALLTGDYGQSDGGIGNPLGGGAMGNAGRGFMDIPQDSYGGGPTEMVGGNMYGAMGKMGGGIGATVGATPFGGAGWGGYTGGGSRGQVPFYRWDSELGRGGGPRTPGPPAPGTPAPPRAPQQPKAGPAGVDHMANLRTLMGEDPRLAQEYRTRSGDTINWWQQNQGNVAQELFGGDNAKMQEWLRGTTATSSNAAPLTQAEMMRLNQMAGIRGPSWLR